MSSRLVCVAGCCLVDAVLEDEASAAYRSQLDFGAGCCLIVDALDDEAWPAYSFHAVGVDLTTDGPRTSEDKVPGRLPDQGVSLISVVSRFWMLEGRLLCGSAWTALVLFPLIDCCCLLVARRCGGLPWSMASTVLLLYRRDRGCERV